MPFYLPFRLISFTFYPTSRKEFIPTLSLIFPVKTESLIFSISTLFQFKNLFNRFFQQGSIGGTNSVFNSVAISTPPLGLSIFFPSLTPLPFIARYPVTRKSLPNFFPSHLLTIFLR